MRTVQVLGLTGALLVSGAVLSAHHTVATVFDTEHVVKLQGRLAEVEWKNPHVVLHLDVTGRTAASSYGQSGGDAIDRPGGWDDVPADGRILAKWKVQRRKLKSKLKAAPFTSVIVAVLALPAVGGPQSEAPPNGRLAFEAATIKPAAPNALANRVMPTAPNRLSIPSMTLSWLIYTAYGDGGFNTAMRVTGGPDWANRTAFAVEGVAPGKTTLRQRRLMLQTLLEERFALKVRAEVSMVDMLTLVVDRRDGTLGPKMKEWNGACRSGTPTDEDDPAMPRCFSGYRPGGISLDGATLFNVAELLSLPQARSLLGGLVADQSGLKGRYTMDLDYPFPPDVTGPSLSTVIQEQWGLRVVPGKGPFKLAVVESARMPVEN